MFNRSLVQKTTAGALLALLMACGDSNVTAPDEIPDIPVAPPQLGVVESLIQITGDGGGAGTTGSNPPSFSLSSLPASVTEDHAWSKSGIPVDTYSGFAPQMAADYGDGTGAKSVTVSQSGGNLVIHPDGTATQEPVSFSFRLAHTYANPGTYNITVLAETYADGVSSRTVTRSITVTEDLNLYIEDFQIADPVVQLAPAAFSFKARGPGNDLYTVKLSYGTNLTQTSAMYPGATYSSTYTWTTPGTYTLRAIISTADGTRADTLNHAVVVTPAPITITAADFGEDLFVGNTGAFGVSANGPAGDPYSVEIDFGDGSEAAALQVAPGGSVAGEHVWAESGLFDVQVVVSNAFTADTAVIQVPVSRAPPSIDDLQMPETLGLLEPSEIVFTANDATEGTTLAYNLELYVEGELVVTFDENVLVERGETVHIPIEAPDYEVEIDLVFVLNSLKNGFIVADTAERHLSIVNTACVAGTYKSGYDCVPAPAGSFVATDGAEAPTLCPVGSYQDQEGWTSCFPAPAGSFVDVTGATQAVLCPLGQYQDQEGSAQCKQAPAGRFVDQLGATEATPCAVGTFQSATGSTSCEPAPLGHFVSSLGASSATACAPGTFAANEGQAACDLAPRGSFVGASGQSQAQLCAPGFYSDVTGAAACKPAPLGSFVAGAGAASFERCPVGTFQASVGQTGCDSAPPGTYVDVVGAAQATACAPGTYQPVAGRASCLDAPAGSFVSGSGRVAATLCAVGTFQSNTGQVSCDQAPIGSYVDVVGATSATMCPLGSSTVTTGSTSASDCISLGQLLLGDIERAVSAGTLSGVGNGRGGEQQLSGWISDLDRSIRFLEGPQRQAGCVGVRNALARGDGDPSPRDQVTGPARAGIAAALQRILDENGCG